MTDRTLVVRFRPRLWEAFWATLVLLVGLVCLVSGGVPLFWRPTTTITCDRQQCVMGYTMLFGLAHGRVELPVADLHDSRLKKNPKSDEQAWVVTNGKVDAELGNLTDSDELLAQYKQLAGELQTFLTDPSKPTFSASYVTNPGSVMWVMLVMGTLITAWGVKWRRGWRAKLVFDPTSRTLTIVQRPWKRSRTIPLSDIAGVALADQTAHTVYGNFRWERVELHAKSGGVLWRFRTMYTKRTYQHVQDSVAAIRKFLGATS